MPTANEVIWKDVCGYEGFYQVSENGDVRSVDRTIECADGRKRYFHGKPLRYFISKNGYKCVTLRRNSSHKSVPVHVLVAEAFIGKRPEGHHVDHIDRDRTNSVLSNLRYIYHSENEAQGSEKQRRPVVQKLNGKEIKRFISVNDASRKTGICAGSISCVCRGIRKTAGGYVWGYA